MDKKMIGMFVAKVVTGSSVGIVVDNIVQATLPTDANKIAKIGARIGGFILSSMVSDYATNYVMEQISDIFGNNEAVDVPVASE